VHLNRLAGRERDQFYSKSPQARVPQPVSGVPACSSETVRLPLPEQVRLKISMALLALMAKGVNSTQSSGSPSGARPGRSS